jgi:hypothetical protein
MKPMFMCTLEQEAELKRLAADCKRAGVAAVDDTE